MNENLKLIILFGLVLASGFSEKIFYAKAIKEIFQTYDLDGQTEKSKNETVHRNQNTSSSAPEPKTSKTSKIISEDPEFRILNNKSNLNTSIHSQLRLSQADTPNLDTLQATNSEMTKVYPRIVKLQNEITRPESQLEREVHDNRFFDQVRKSYNTPTNEILQKRIQPDSGIEEIQLLFIDNCTEFLILQDIEKMKSYICILMSMDKQSIAKQAVNQSSKFNKQRQSLIFGKGNIEESYFTSEQDQKSKSGGGILGKLNFSLLMNDESTIQESIPIKPIVDEKEKTLLKSLIAEIGKRIPLNYTFSDVLRDFFLKCRNTPAQRQKKRVFDKAIK